MTDIGKIDEYLVAHLDESLSELSRLVAQPSVGAQTVGLEACAQLVGDMLRARGFQVDLMSTRGAPVVFGDLPGRSAATLLIYSHHDVSRRNHLNYGTGPHLSPLCGTEGSTAAARATTRGTSPRGSSPWMRC